MPASSNTTVQTRQNLMEAFWELYTVKRIEKITIREITSRAGYNRGTFYEYFKDVYDVLSQIEDELIADLQQITPVSLLTEAPIPLDQMMNKLVTHRKYLAVLLGDHGDPSFQHKIKASYSNMIVQQLANTGITMNMELEIVLEYALSAMIGVTGSWLQQGEKIPIDQLVKLLQRITQDGLLQTIRAQI
ncbi:TetR/AcrR family transcriptional regulator [Paenibacillus glycanilyticus]|uniref:TetR/AcrR family transcriptional regulator n=1 Tax=Paenibacillus glycanilyticus TaxID=126569 RepID=UPI003EB95732